jgi:hypothetical protein
MSSTHADDSATEGMATGEAPGAMPSPPAPFRDWLREGVRTAFFRRPAIAAWQQPTPAALAGLAVLVLLLQLGIARLEIAGPARFYPQCWLGAWWSIGVSALLAWALLRSLPNDPRRPCGLAAWLALGFGSSVPLLVFTEALAIARTHGGLGALLGDNAWAAWGGYLLVVGWAVGITLYLGRVFGMGAGRLVLLLVATVALQGITTWKFDTRPWYPDRRDEPERERFTLSQAVFEQQQAAWTAAVDQLAPQRPGVVDVYGIVFAPYASEDVFLRESTMVAGVLAQRFDAQGRVLQMVNHMKTSATLPWATPTNLRRAVDAAAARMDKDEDVLVVYLTSHGGRDFRLAASHWPLQVEDLQAGQLREALDAAGIRHRVVAVSACYSGGWIEPLASESTLVMTAADSTHTSYGCGHRSPLTFFGRAMFDEQLRQTHSFEEAFAAAVPVIRRREEEGRKPDGFSNPQIRVGPAIRPVLQALARRLDEAGAAAK